MNNSTNASVVAQSQPAERSAAGRGRRNSTDQSTMFASRILRGLLHESVAFPLLILVLFTVMLVSPKAQFPLNDDWVYTKSVQELLEKGSAAGHPFAAASTVMQVFWGALFCKVFGFGFTTLRISTITLSWIGAWAAARSALALGLTRWPAILCGAVVYVSPLVLNLSYTFMSDVPFLAFSALSGLFYLRALEKPSTLPVVWGSIFGVMACLTRQFGIMLPACYVAVAAWFVVQHRYRVTSRMIATFAGIWVLGAAIMLYFMLTKPAGLVLPVNPAHGSWPHRVLDGLHYAAIAMCYLGFFLLPLAPNALAAARRSDGVGWKSGAAALLAICAVLTGLLWTQGLRRLPELGIGNLLYDLGVGPMTLSDAYLGFFDWIPLRLGLAWWPITAGAVLTAGLLLRAAITTANQSARRTTEDETAVARTRQRLFLSLWGAAMLACPWNPWLPKAFDRYFVAAVVPFALLLGHEVLRTPSVRAIRFTIAGCALMYLFSAASLHDYFAWNHARWALIERLQQKYGVPSGKIDGGFEFNGMYTSDEFMALHSTRNFFDSSSPSGGYWVMDNEYVLGISGRRPGYEVVLREPYFSWLGWRPGEVVVFHRSVP